ncbi:phosphotransferase family protein [Sphingobium bisphenolivorans]|uniref:phosphotransferase family protein n=1 Tax=Sphingobium bisphenolivorans TaxID=1335760 RepID=UPI00047F9E10|nr:aminoglycoside phosphotransferase family protein [Sphingobium bisphenolivorans]
MLSAELIPLASGASSRVCRLPGERVVKIFHAAVSDEMIAREFTAATLAAEGGVPTARPLREDMIEGARAILYPEVQGPTLMRQMRARPLQSDALLRDMALLHRQIHGCAAPSLRSLKQVLATDISYGPAEPVVQDAALALLQELPEGESLLHGDFHISNILLSAEGPIAIDWSKAAHGAATADVLRSEMLLRFGEGPQDWLTNHARDWAARRYMTHYRRCAGEPLSLEPQWRAVVALAWLRARGPVRQRAFTAYLHRALAAVGLPLPVVTSR